MKRRLRAPFFVPARGEKPMVQAMALITTLLLLAGPEQAEGTCRFINSTDLRRYLVREQVVRGMTREQVRRAFGNPPETYINPREVWIYQTRYYGALYELTYVYFRDGCVERVEYRKP
ncbi:hypothetical protein [Marinobacter subterrani]|nr:hypothetical protein [Marinobacter subterrani]